VEEDPQVNHLTAQVRLGEDRSCVIRNWTCPTKGGGWGSKKKLAISSFVQEYGPLTR
jgi:hypothetical protein